MFTTYLINLVHSRIVEYCYHHFPLKLGCELLMSNITLRIRSDVYRPYIFISRTLTR